MYKVFLLSFALGALVAARPGVVVEQESVLAKVGDIAHIVPSAISQQSQTVVHGRTNIVSDVVAPVAAVSTAAVLPSTVADVRSVAILPPSEISFHGTPLLRGLAAASALATPTVHIYAAPVAFLR